MSSDKKREANRRNAEKSTGPKSAAGRARTRFNALKDGTFAADHVLPGEDPQELQQIVDGYFQYWEPVGRPEISLVLRMVGDEWRLLRFVRAEKASLEAPRDNSNAPAVALAQPTYEQLLKLQSILEKQIALLRAREDRATENVPATPDEALINEQRAELYAALLEGLAPGLAGGRLTLIHDRMEKFERSLERKMAKLIDLQAWRKKRRRP